MFGIIAEKIEEPDKTIRYVFKMKSIKFSDHVKYDIPVTSMFWSHEIDKAISSLPEVCNPITNNIQSFVDSDPWKSNKSDSGHLDAIKSRSLSQTNMGRYLHQWNHSANCSFFKEHTSKGFGSFYKAKRDINEQIKALTQLSVNTMDVWERLMDQRGASRLNWKTDGSSPGLKGFYDHWIRGILSTVDIVPDNFTYTDLLKTAKKRLSDNWTQFNVIRLCQSIACLEEHADFRDTRKAIYDIKPELKGSIKKIEDLTDFDPEIFTIDDFSNEDHEYHIINLSMNSICYESDFTMTFLKPFRELDGDLVPSEMDSYIDGTKGVFAFLGVNYELMHEVGSYNTCDYQVISDLAFNNCWIMEYIKDLTERPFALYPCSLGSEMRSVLQDELSQEGSFSQIGSIELEAKDPSLARSKEYLQNDMSNDIGKIAALIGRKLEVSFPLKLSSAEIDMIVNDLPTSKRWTICSNGKILSGSYGGRQSRRDYSFVTREVEADYGTQLRVIANAQINVESASTNIFEIKYEPIFGSDMTVAAMKDLMKSMGFSSINGTKDNLRKRFAECMVKHYEKNIDIISSVFQGMRMICIMQDSLGRGNGLKGMKLVNIIDEHTKSKIVPEAIKRNENLMSYQGCEERILSCLLVCFIKTHNYADSIFSPDFVNKMTTSKGCMEDLVLRSWGQDIIVKLVETSGEF